MVNTVKPKNSIERHISEFARLKDVLPGSQLSWLRELRHQAMAYFSEVGFPTRKDEAWRYMPMHKIQAHEFQTCAQSNAEPTQVPNNALTEDLDCYTFVITNGKLNSALSNGETLPAGINVKSLAKVIEEQPELIEPYFAKLAKPTAHAFIALNTAFASDGIFIEIAEGIKVDKPIHIQHVVTEDNTANHIRNIIVVNNHAELTLLESFTGAAKTPYLTNAVTELYAAENTNVDHYKCQQEQTQAIHFSHVTVRQQRDSAVSSHSFSFGGAISRSDAQFILDDQGCESTLNGLYFAKGDQYMDQQLFIDHQKPHGTSQQNYKGIMADKATGVFNGTIYVAQDAQKTQATQSNQNLLLSRQATANTKPQLNIFANDVKCQHGSTVGQLDEKALFYMRSRGIDLQTAKNMLSYAFASEVIDSVRLPSLKTQLKNIIKNDLQQE